MVFSRKKLCDLLYYFPIVILYISLIFCCDSMLNSRIGIDIGKIYSLSKYFAAMLLVFRFFIYQRYKIQQLFVCGLLVSLVMIVTHLSESDLILFSFLFVITGKRINYEKLFKIIFLAELIGVITIVFMSMTGMIQSMTAVRNIDGEYQVRNSLGFAHVNLLGAHVLIIIFCWVYLRYEKLNFFDYLAMAGISFIVSSITYSRTSSYLILLMIFTIIICKIIDKRKKNKLILSSFVLFILLAPILSCTFPLFMYGTPIFNTLDSVLSHRLTFIRLFYLEYGYSLFGTKIETVGTIEAYVTGKKAMILDNAYAHLAISYGILMLLLFVIASLWIAVFSYKKGNYKVLAIIFCISVWGLTETCYFKIQYNTFIILYSSLLYATNKAQLAEIEKPLLRLLKFRVKLPK